MLFDAMKLSKDEIRKFNKRFRKYDMDKSGLIDIVEFLTLIDVERTRFTERVFAVFDQDKSGRINFREFVLSVWNYCTLSKASLELFTFDLYDENGSGILARDEVQSMLKEIYGRDGMKSNPRAKQIERELMQLDKQRDLNIEAFQIFSKTHHNLLFPAFMLQLKLRRKVLGEAFWNKATERRIKLSDRRYVTLGELLQVHLNEELYNKIVNDGVIVNGKRRQVNSGALRVLDATGTAYGRTVTDKEHNRPATATTTTSTTSGSSSSSSSLSIGASSRKGGRKKSAASQLNADEAAAVSAAAAAYNSRNRRTDGSSSNNTGYYPAEEAQVPPPPPVPPAPQHQHIRQHSQQQSQMPAPPSLPPQPPAESRKGDKRGYASHRRGTGSSFAHRPEHTHKKSSSNSSSSVVDEGAMFRYDTGSGSSSSRSSSNNK